MVVKKHIAKNLNKLDKKFNEYLTSPDVDLPVYFSKLATIEYCGWLEETLDDIVSAFAKRRLKTQPFIDILKNKIKDTYGFKYKKHFRPMLVHVVGIIRCERIQSALEKDGGLSTLESELSTYAVHRNNAAHTHIDSVASYPSPAATLASMRKVYPVLKKIYAMRKEDRYC